MDDETMPLNLKSLKTKFTIRFLRALRNINHQDQIKIHDLNPETNNNGTLLVAQRYYKVKVAADESMASVIGPRRAWSRATLFRIRPGSRTRRRRHRREIIMRRRRREQRQGGGGGGQAEELRRLVPGGEDMDLQSLLDETAHYVKCLATQVNVMRNIVNYCSN